MEPEDKAEGAAPAAPKKSKLGLVVIGAVVAIGTSSAAGAVFGPSLASRGHPAEPAKAASKESAGGEGAEPAETADLEPLIVDLREGSGELHHLKVGIAIELLTAIKEEEWKGYTPRARDAAISYLRSLTFDDVTAPAKFDGIRNELGERIAKALGKDRVKRVLFTDFVAQ